MVGPSRKPFAVADNKAGAAVGATTERIVDLLRGKLAEQLTVDVRVTWSNHRNYRASQKGRLFFLLFFLIENNSGLHKYHNK